MQQDDYEESLDDWELEQYDSEVEEE